MALLQDALQEKKFDIRLMERNISRGLLNDDEVQKALKQLPDDSANAEWISLETLKTGDVS
jgi:hypothetical protein